LCVYKKEGAIFLVVNSAWSNSLLPKMKHKKFSPNKSSLFKLFVIRKILF